MINASYDRSWEPNYLQLQLISLGGAFVSTLMSQPLDVLKTKIQIYNEGIGMRGRHWEKGYNPYKIFTNFQNQGYGSKMLYTGLAESLSARFSFLIVRNSVYKILYDFLKPRKITNDLNAKERGLLGGLAGIAGAFVSNPFECAYVRKVGDLGREGKFLRSNYNYNVFAGVQYAAARAFLINYFMLWPYEVLKENCHNTFGDVWVNTPIALIAASFLTTVIALPVDAMKTRLQNVYQNKELNRYAAYERDTGRHITKIIQHEGLSTFYAGFFTYYARTFVFGLSTVYVCDKLTQVCKK